VPAWAGAFPGECTIGALHAPFFTGKLPGLLHYIHVIQGVIVLRLTRVAFTSALTVAGACAFSSLALASSLSSNPLPAGLPTAAAPAGTICGPTLLTQTTSQVPVAGTISCNSAGNTAENSYYRAYASTAFPAGFNVCAVELAIESSLAGTGTTQPMTINVYRQSGGAFPAGTRTLVGTAAVQVPNANLTSLSVPVTAAIPAGEDLVVEALIPDGVAATNRLFLGSNAAGQTGSAFLRAPSCGASTPTSLASLGFPNVHMILNARGSAGSPAAIGLTPPTVDFGNVVAGSTSAVLSATITNTGGSPLTITAIAAPTAPFTQTANTCIGTPVAGGGTCTVSYRFAPTAAGVFTNNLAITSNAGAASIPLQGTGLAAPALPVPGPGPLALLFGALGLLGVGALTLRRRSAA
jgi:hypothetical protein